MGPQAYKARAHELTQTASVRILDELMENTIGERLNVAPASPNFLVDTWIPVKRSAGPLPPRSIPGVVNEHLPASRHKASLASLTATELEAWRDAELVVGRERRRLIWDQGFSDRLKCGLAKGIIPANTAKAADFVGDDGDTRSFYVDRVQACSMPIKMKGAILVGVGCSPRLADVASLERRNVNLITSP